MFGIKYSNLLAITLLQTLYLFMITKAQCPGHVYRYYWNETTKELGGLIKITTPPQEGSLSLRVTLEVPLGYPISNYGKLNLAKSLDESVQAVYEGRPLYYIVKFPFQQPIPTVSSITLNDVEYCFGSPDFGIIKTKIYLEHSFGTIPRGKFNDHITLEWLNEIEGESKPNFSVNQYTNTSPVPSGEGDYTTEFTETGNYNETILSSTPSSTDTLSTEKDEIITDTPITKEDEIISFITETPNTAKYESIPFSAFSTTPTTEKDETNEPTESQFLLRKIRLI